MSNTIRIIPNTAWVHTPTGKKASIYGAAPWGFGPNPGTWEVVTTGYTWERVSYRGNVTVGLGRVPAKTYEEAVEVAEKFSEATGAKFIREEAA